MREVKEKSPLKACAADTLKSAPQAAFRRGADAAVQQLRQELCEAAQDGQPEDRYESSKITETADHAVRQAERLAEKAIHKHPKTKSAPQGAFQNKSANQHEPSQQNQYSTATPQADATVSERPVHHPQAPSQKNSTVRESASPIMEKRVFGADIPQPKVRETAQPIQETVAPIKEKPVQQRGTAHRSETNGELSTWDEKQNVPHRTEHPKDHPQRIPVREQSVPQRADATCSALSEIKTKEYVRKQRKKQDISKRNATDIGNAARDSETVLPTIRTREAVREQQSLHVSHAPKPEQTAAPQIRTRRTQAISMHANTESAKPDAPQPPLPDIKNKQKYIAAQQPTQVTPVQVNPQQAAQKMIRGNSELCQPALTNEPVPVPASRNVDPTKPVRVQKQARPTFAKKQKVKTVPNAKTKPAAPAVKALPSKMPAAAPNQAVVAVCKGQLLRNTVVKTAKAAKEAGKNVLRALRAAAERLAAAIGAGGAAAVAVVVVILLVGMLFASPLGILFAGEDTGTEIKIPDAVATLNGAFTDAIYCIMEENPYDELDVQAGMEAAMLQNWRNVLAVYAVKVSTDEKHGTDVVTMDEEKIQLLREIFFDTNKLDYELTTQTVNGERITTLHISAQIKDAMQMADEYGFTPQQREMLEELLKPDYDDIFLSLIGSYQSSGTSIDPIDISDIQGILPDDLDPMRETIVLTAYQLLGKVTYFWGGKSLVLGWDSRWGTPTTVTAPGSGSTGKVLPFGLDCSGFVDWTFYNATGGSYLPGRGGGAASQHGYCTNIAWADALPGDLVFYADDNHVGIICGYDSVGNLLVIHCSGGQNGVVVTGREGLAVAARPDLFTD